jgi:hypothetical protein
MIVPKPLATNASKRIGDLPGWNGVFALAKTPPGDRAAAEGDRRRRAVAILKRQVEPFRPVIREMRIE